MLKSYISRLPVITTHEHIGSLLSANFTGALFAQNPDTRPGFIINKTTLFDLVFSPYLHGYLRTVGYTGILDKTLFYEMNEQDQNQIWTEVVPFLKRCRGSGLYIALDLALKDLYGASLEEMMEGILSWQSISQKIMLNYDKGLAVWSREMFELAGINYAVKPVHTPYIQLMWDDSAEAIEEYKNFLPILRIDDLLGWKTPESLCNWAHMENILGIKINNIESIEYMVTLVFKLIDEKKINCTKQTQAYLRTLEFNIVSREKAIAVWESEDVSKSEEAKKIIQDYIMCLIMNEQQKRKIPHQIHTGMTNLPFSNPALIRPIIEAYPEVDFILLHCYPYVSEAAYLARVYQNVYLDTAWLALQSPYILYSTLQEWIGFVPFNKIFMSGDATSVEEAYGALKITKKVLTQVLEEKINRGEIDIKLAMDIAKALLYDNAQQMYGISCQK